jgi:hypothetical protein
VIAEQHSNNVAERLSIKFNPLLLIRRFLQDDVPYTAQALREDLRRVRTAWDECQAKRDRDAIYRYLSAVFDLVTWWTAENRAVERARRALQLRNISPSDYDEPFAAIIHCTADPEKVDRRTRSKWSRVLRYAMEYKSSYEPLAAFVQRKGGINKCAARFTRCLGRRRQSGTARLRQLSTAVSHQTGDLDAGGDR